MRKVETTKKMSHDCFDSDAFKIGVIVQMGKAEKFQYVHINNIICEMGFKNAQNIICFNPSK